VTEVDAAIGVGKGRRDENSARHRSGVEKAQF
jgi:hypothetical protein